MGVGGIIGIQNAQPLPTGDTVGNFSPTSPIKGINRISDYVHAAMSTKGTTSGGGGGTVIVVNPTTTFIFRGYYLAGATYEFWTGTSRNTPPTSGHTLLNVTVVGEMPQTGIF